MNMKNLSAAGLLLSAVIAANANVVTNGGFEAGLTGWVGSGLTCSGIGATYGGASGCVGYDSDPGPHSGAAALYLGTASGGGTVSQTFATVLGATYAIEFWLANGTYNGTSTPNALLVEFDGADLLSYANSPAQPYTFYSFNLVATGSTGTLSFTNQQVPSAWLIDDVSVTVVPEPMSLALVGVALAGLGLTSRRTTQGGARAT